MVLRWILQKRQGAAAEYRGAGSRMCNNGSSRGCRVLLLNAAVQSATCAAKDPCSCIYRPSTSNLKDSHFSHPTCAGLANFCGVTAGHKIRQFKKASSQFVFLPYRISKRIDEHWNKRDGIRLGKICEICAQKKWIAFQDRLRRITYEIIRCAHSTLHQCCQMYGKVSINMDFWDDTDFYTKICQWYANSKITLNFKKKNTC